MCKINTILPLHQKFPKIIARKWTALSFRVRILLLVRMRLFSFVPGNKSSRNLEITLKKKPFSPKKWRNMLQNVQNVT